jgi:hypothetical protein
MLVDPYGLCGGSGWFGNAVSSANRIYGEISDAPQQIGRGLSDGVYLAGNGASLGLLGDDAQLSSLQKEYGGWATASRVLSGTSTVLATAGGGMEYLGARGLIAAGTEVASNPGIVNRANSAINAINLGKSLASEAQMGEGGIPFAGENTGTVFRNAANYAAKYGGNASDWVKKTSTTYESSDGTAFQTHWVENIITGQRVEFKTKLGGP